MYEDERMEEELERKYKAEMELKKAKEQLEKAEAEEKRKADAKKAVEDWQREEASKKLKEKKEEEEIKKKVDEHLRRKYAEDGYSPDEIEAKLNEEEKAKTRHIHETRIARLRPTHIKVHTRYLLPETLDAYGLPWEYYEHDRDYIIIREQVSDDFQDELFSHTRKLRSRKLIEGPIEKQTILKIRDEKKDEMFLVRKKKGKSPVRVVVRRAN